MDVDTPESPLLSIPLEVLLHITSYLTTPEYGNVRQTCKGIEANLLNAFAREFFTKRQFMLTEFSLQALVDISNSRLSRYVNHIIIALERPTSTHIAQPNTSAQAQARNNCLLLEYVSHMTLINAGQDVEMLAEAFSNLENLETIGLRDFNSRSRSRDYPQNQWRSYGYNTYTQGTGVNLEDPRIGPAFSHPTMRNDLNTYLSKVFLTILRALGKSSSRPKHFEVIVRHLQLFDQTFNLPKYVETAVQPVLANLRTLFLDLSPHYPNLVVDVDNKPTACVNYFLLPFLSKLTHLEHLRLNFRSYPDRDRNDIISWLSKKKEDTVASPNSSLPGTSLQFPPSVDFAHLRQLDIGMVLIDPVVLLAIVKKYRATLRAISFHKVTLLEADSVDAEHRVNLWSKLFTQLSKLDLKLDFLNMSFLAQTQMGLKRHRSITFKGSRNPTVKKWGGTDIQSGLRDFINDVVVSRLDQDTESESEPSEEEDHDDSMDDDDEGDGEDDE